MGIYFHLYTLCLLYERDFIFKQVQIHVLIYSIDYIDFELHVLYSWNLRICFGELLNMLFIF